MPEPELSKLEQQILKAKLKVQAEMPDVADAPVEPFGPLARLASSLKEKLIGGGNVIAMATGDGVQYSPEVMGQVGPSDIEDTLAHELVHVRQGREKSKMSFFDQVKAKLESIKEGYLPYGQQPDELEAYQYEGDRAVREGRPPAPTPKFHPTAEDIASGRMLREKGNYILMPEKRK